MIYMSENGYSNYQLSNGLTVHLKEMHTAPIISSWIWYRVGLRNEKVGKTGLSHWVEHMQFKGTKRFPPAVLDKVISRLGGNWNAFTNLDWTTYYETLPSNSFEIALELEADRMIHSKFLPREVESERTVVISEREGSENNPLFLLGEAVSLAAFEQHPYRYDTGGSMADLHAISREDLYRHYQDYYKPSNATLCISGDFSTSQMIDMVSKHFESLPPGPPHDEFIAQENPAKGSKAVTLNGPGETEYIQVAYHSPKAASDDFFALTVLDSIFTGPSGLNMFGAGGTSNKTSRLYQALVETEIAVSAHGNLQATVDPYLYNFHFIVHPDRTSRDVIKVLDEKINDLQQEPVSLGELERAIKQARALFIYGSENITNQAFWMGYASQFATYQWFTGYVERLSRVTPADILDVAQRYLREDNRVVGIYTPRQGNARPEVQEVIS